MSKSLIKTQELLDTIQDNESFLEGLWMMNIKDAYLVQIAATFYAAGYHQALLELEVTKH